MSCQTRWLPTVPKRLVTSAATPEKMTSRHTGAHDPVAVRTLPCLAERRETSNSSVTSAAAIASSTGPPCTGVLRSLQLHVAVQRARRFKTAATVRVLDGRGGDRRHRRRGRHQRRASTDLPAEVLPGGFSGGWGDSRRPQITKSFKKALEHSPDEWTLVVPCGAFRSSAERRGPAAPRSGAQPGFVTRQFRLTSCSTSARLAHFSPVTCKPAP
jgi:hypothetical protein